MDTEEDIENESIFDNETVVRQISFEFKNNEKIAVIGKVGSGKTSLFLTILKELCIVKGKL
jgi:ABC-type Mn2+/Zn2+ transport system ATPase subunit